MKKILVAGATGYLGSHICGELKKQGFHVRALVRKPEKLQKLSVEPDEIWPAEITRPATLTGCCKEMDAVISTIGITRQKDGMTYMEVDYQGNLNLLREAMKAGIRKFIFVFIANAEEMPHLKIIEAKQRFADELKRSGIDYCIIKPNGFFADMKDFLEMARKGRIYLFGNGHFKINPVAGRDLAEVCVNSLSKDEREIAVGGPEILTHRQIAEAAFGALGKKTKITCIPVWFKNLLLFLLRRLTGVTVYGPVEFFMTVMTRNMIAPQYGSRTLQQYYNGLVKQDRPAEVKP